MCFAHDFRAQPRRTRSFSAPGKKRANSVQTRLGGLDHISFIAAIISLLASDDKDI
jgi:hypothetical protein